MVGIGILLLFFMSVESEIFINEVLTRNDARQIPFIELYNSINETVDISNWFITNASSPIGDVNTIKVQLPSGIIVPPLGYLVLHTSSFSTLSFPPTGGVVAIYDLSYAQIDIFYFGVTPSGKSYGRYQTPDGHIVETIMSQVTNGTANGLPLVWPVIFSEILYDANSYVVLLNTQPNFTNIATIYRNPWKIIVSNNAFTLPMISLEAGFRMVVTGLARENFNSTLNFFPQPRTLIISLPGFSVTRNDNISLIQPDELVSDYTTNPSFITTESVSYSSWPVSQSKPNPNPNLIRRGIKLFPDDTYTWASTDSPVAVSCCYFPNAGNSLIKRYPNIVYPLDPVFVPAGVLSAELRAIFYSLFVIVMTILTIILFLLSVNWLLVNGIALLEQQ